jgi:hypothetical protein
MPCESCHFRLSSFHRVPYVARKYSRLVIFKKRNCFKDMQLFLCRSIGRRRRRFGVTVQCDAIGRNINKIRLEECESGSNHFSYKSLSVAFVSKRPAAKATSGLWRGRRRKRRLHVCRIYLVSKCLDLLLWKV